VLTSTALAYLKKRGYTDERLSREEITSIPIGETTVHGVQVFTERESVAFLCRSMSEEVSLVHCAAVTGAKDYRSYQSTSKGYLAPIYGSKEDRDLLYTTQELILVEGVFDRVAMKVLFSERAVFARLTKGATGQLVEHLQVFCKKMYSAFDGDVPGVLASVRSEKKLKPLGVDVVRLQCPFKDPSAFLASKGMNSARKHYERQISASDF